MLGTGWAAGDEMGTIEEVVVGVIEDARGVEVEAGVIGAARGVEGEAGVIMVVHGTGEVVGVSEWVIGPPGVAVGLSTSAMSVVRPTTSTTRVVRPPGCAIRPSGGAKEPLVGRAVRPPASVTAMIRLPEGTVRPPFMVIGVPTLRCVPMGESTRSILDKDS
jgi:hypothetical protein